MKAYAKVNKVFRKHRNFSNEQEHKEFISELDKMKMIVPIWIPLSIEISSLVFWFFGVLLAIDQFHPFLGVVSLPNIADHPCH